MSDNPAVLRRKLKHVEDELRGLIDSLDDETEVLDIHEKLSELWQEVRREK